MKIVKSIMKSAYSQGWTATHCYWGKCWHRNISHDSFMFDPKIGKSAKTWWIALDKISGQPLAFCHFVNSSAKRHCFMGGFRKNPPEPKQASMHLVLFPHRVADASQSRRILEMRKCMKSCNLIDHHVLICTQKNLWRAGFHRPQINKPFGLQLTTPFLCVPLQDGGSSPAEKPHQAKTKVQELRQWTMLGSTWRDTCPRRFRRGFDDLVILKLQYMSIYRAIYTSKIAFFECLFLAFLHDDPLDFWGVNPWRFTGESITGFSTKIGCP